MQNPTYAQSQYIGNDHQHTPQQPPVYTSEEHHPSTSNVPSDNQMVYSQLGDPVPNVHLNSNETKEQLLFQESVAKNIDGEVYVETVNHKVYPDPEKGVSCTLI